MKINGGEERMEKNNDGLLNPNLTSNVNVCKFMLSMLDEFLTLIVWVGWHEDPTLQL